jgi:hypothetical protein
MDSWTLIISTMPTPVRRIRLIPPNTQPASSLLQKREGLLPKSLFSSGFD